MQTFCQWAILIMSLLKLLIGVSYAGQYIEKPSANTCVIAFIISMLLYIGSGSFSNIFTIILK